MTNKLAKRPARRLSVVKTVPRARQATATGGLGYAYDAKSELFTLACANMVSEKTYHEGAAERDARYVELIHKVTFEDSAWVARFVPFLRKTMFMRTASIIMAAEYVAAGGENGRGVVSSAISRADEPAEMLGYWHSVYGRKLPAAIKRGVADAVARLYTERNALKYDGANHPWRFADVIEVVHPTPKGEWQSRLFKYLLDERHHHDGWNIELINSLPAINADRLLRDCPEELRREALSSQDWETAGWSWERLSGWLPGGMDAQAWEAAIPNMGYMALLRNLRNFDDAKISAAAVDYVTKVLTNPTEVAKSMQFPFRIYSAYKEIGSLRWAPALETALDLTLDNVPSFAGRTLILVDLSPSMGPNYGGFAMGAHSKRYRYEIAALFGAAIGKRAASATLAHYSGPSTDVTHDLRKPLLRCVESADAWMKADRVGGTETFRALHDHFANHDRVIILTDEQAHDAGRYTLPDVPVYTFNLAGYQTAHAPHGSGNVHSFAGLSDAAFRILPLLEQRKDGAWPF